jgi:hypothetical protein
MKKEEQHKTLSELEDIKREAKDRLAQREKEYKYIETLNKDNLNKFLTGLDGTTLVNVLTKEDKKHHEIMENNMRIEIPDDTENLWWNTVESRKLKTDDTKKQFLKIKDKFYDQIGQHRQNEITNLLEIEKKRMAPPGTDDDLERLSETYYAKYTKFLKDQRTAETERLRRNNLLGDMAEWNKTLLEKQDINKPKRWNWDLLKQDEQHEVNYMLKRKIRELSDKSMKYDIDYEGDITRHIDAYLYDKLKAIDIEKLESVRQSTGLLQRRIYQQ